MDILTEIYRIKQVMGLITEQNDKSLVDENVYEAIKNIESVFSFTDKNGNIKGETYTGKEKESNIKKAIEDTIGLDYWFRIKPELRGQIYSFMYQADSSENSLYRWLAGLAQSIDPNIERKNVFAEKVPKRDANGKIMLDNYGNQIMEILPRDKLADDKKSNIDKAIDTVKKAIDNDKINYPNYLNIVKQQYDKLGGTPNDAQNRIKIWEPRPEALDKLMRGESWPDVKAWWYKKIGETDPTTQVNNASTQKDSASANPNVAQPPVIQKQDSASANTAQPNTAAPSITTSQATVQSSEDLVIDTIRDGEHGDPYVYIRNKAGDFLTFKCGKKDENCPYLRTNPNTVKWINVSQKVRDGAGEKYVTAETAIKTSIYKEDSITPEEEETTLENDINLKIKKAFRNEYYKYLIKVIKRKLTENKQGYTKVARTPCFYNNTSGCGKDYTFVFRNLNDNKKYFKIILDAAKTILNSLPQTDISDASLNEAMNKFTNQMMSTGITIGDKPYKIGGKKQNSIMELSKVFDADNSEPKHVKNTKVQNLIKGKDFYINKA